MKKDNRAELIAHWESDDGQITLARMILASIKEITVHGESITVHHKNPPGKVATMQHGETVPFELPYAEEHMQGIVIQVPIETIALVARQQGKLVTPV